MSWHRVLHSFALATDARDDHADEGREDGEAHQAPNDQVVDEHEVAGAVLVKSFVVRVECFALGIGEGVTRCEGARGLEPPDDSGDPPGESAATEPAADDATEDLLEGLTDASGNGHDNTGASRGEGHDEAPVEPKDEKSMDIGQFSVARSCGLGLCGKEVTLSVGIDAVPGLLIRVVEREDAEVDDQGHLGSDAGEGAEAANALGRGAGGLHRA